MLYGKIFSNIICKVYVLGDVRNLFDKQAWFITIHSCMHTRLSFCLCLCSILEGGVSLRTILCSSCVVYDCIKVIAQPGTSAEWQWNPLMTDHPSLKTPVNPSLDHFMKMNHHQSSSFFEDSFCKLFTWSFYEDEPITKLRLPFLDLLCGQVGFQLIF